MSAVKSWLKTNWILLLLFLVVLTWQTCTWLYLRNELPVWLNGPGGGDGTDPPKPPPRF